MPSKESAKNAQHLLFYGGEILLKETIVVEGKNDAAAVKRAVEADIIITSGFGITKETLKLIRMARDRKGVIILTDPDFMGEKLRKIIADRIDGVKHAFISKEEASKEGDIGIENASPESIRKALSMAKWEAENEATEFTIKDLIENALVGNPYASENRNKIGNALGIGYANAKQFLYRLNRYGISRQEFKEALEESGRNTN
mgnify:FL=1